MCPAHAGHSVGKIAREVLAGGHALRQRAYPLKIVFFYVLSRRPGQATDASAMRSARGGQAPTFGSDAPVPLGRPPRGLTEPAYSARRSPRGKQTEGNCVIA